MSLSGIRDAIAPLRRTLLEHPIYAALETPAALRTFMQFHVFAVWDFMSLLKTLQQRICCTAVPWLPPENAAAARLLNEIVLGEETDDDGRGGFASHFELYRRAMRGFGANVEPIDRFVQQLRDGRSLEQAFAQGEIAEPIRNFVRRTFAVIGSGDLCRISSAFTFGREDLLPGVFQKIVDRLDAKTGGGLADFQFYLQRHIDLDGGEHGPAAMQLVSGLCGDEPAKWAAARGAAVEALEARVELWNGMHAAVTRSV